MILLAGQAGRASNITTLGPNTMVRALAAMVLGGMVSFRGSLIAGVLIGVVQSLVRFNVDRPGMVEFVLLGAILIAVFWRARVVEPGGSVRDLAADAAADPRAGEGDLVGALDADRCLRPRARRRRSRCR